MIIIHMEITGNKAYEDILLEEGRLKLQQWALGRCLHRTWLKNKGADYDYSSDPKIVSQAARTLAATANPQRREEALASFKSAWWVFHLYFNTGGMGKIEATYKTLMDNVREAMRKGNAVPLIGPEVNKVSGETGKKLGEVINLADKRRKKDD